MKQKKFYKTFKFWITSLLALSASSIIASLALTSCVANDSANKSDIVINDQTQDQEISIDENKGLTLSVEATSNRGEDLSYQWYVDKNSSNIWEKILGATNKNYTIPISELKNVTSETTWRYKAEIYHTNDSKKVESKPIPVKIKPPIGGSIPENPNEPIPPITPPSPEVPTPSPTPPPSPEVPTPSPTPPPSPEVPTPSPTPPNNNFDNPSIMPSPGHKPSQGIGARLPLDKTGIITTKYEQEKWIGDNSVSIAIEAKPNSRGISDAVNKLKENTELDINVKKMLDSMVGAISNAYDYSYNQFGTGWILDYSNNENKDLTDYYIASNMHVLNSYFELLFESTRYNSHSYEDPITVGVRIPFNNHTVSSLDVYISQPTYNTNSHTNNLKTYADKLSSQWYKTNINIENWNNSLIPIGAYNLSNGNGFEYSQAFDMELTWQYQNNSNFKETLYFKSNDNGSYLANKPTIGNDNYQYNVDDFSVFKITLSNDAFENKIKENDEYKNMFIKMKELFNISSTSNVDERSSYIKKLNKLLDITSDRNSYSKLSVDKLFMFGDSKGITNIGTQISIGGYPLIQELVPNGNSYKRQSYTTFNTNTLTGNNIIDYPDVYYPSRDKMGINQYTYKGKLYKIRWKGQNNFVLKNVNLLAGSSGGLAIDQNYKISCINWGSYLQIEYHDNIKYVLDSSTSTGLYSPTDKSSLVWKWIDYLKKNSKETKLSKLFTQLEKHGYFNN